MADKSKGVHVREEEIQGQPQARAADPDDGKVQVREAHIRLDEPVLDPNSDEAVQIPEGVGARAEEVVGNFAAPYQEPTVEDKFGNDELAPKATGTEVDEDGEAAPRRTRRRSE